MFYFDTDYDRLNLRMRGAVAMEKGEITAEEP